MTNYWIRHYIHPVHSHAIYKVSKLVASFPRAYPEEKARKWREGKRHTIEPWEVYCRAKGEREREGSRRRKVATIRIFTGVIRYEPHNARNDGARCQRNSRRREVVHERSRPWKWAVGELDFSWGRRKLKIRQEYTGLVRSGSGWGKRELKTEDTVEE